MGPMPCRPLPAWQPARRGAAAWLPAAMAAAAAAALAADLRKGLGWPARSATSTGDQDSRRRIGQARAAAGDRRRRRRQTGGRLLLGFDSCRPNHSGCTRRARSGGAACSSSAQAAAAWASPLTRCLPPQQVLVLLAGAGGLHEHLWLPRHRGPQEQVRSGRQPKRALGVQAKRWHEAIERSNHQATAVGQLKVPNSRRAVLGGGAERRDRRRDALAGSCSRWCWKPPSTSSRHARPQLLYAPLHVTPALASRQPFRALPRPPAPSWIGSTRR